MKIFPPEIMEKTLKMPENRSTLWPLDRLEKSPFNPIMTKSPLKKMTAPQMNSKVEVT
jgi:hypothetical protein